MAVGSATTADRNIITVLAVDMPSAKRRSQFNVGAKYDIDNVGIVVTQDGPTLSFTDCDDLNSGRSRCGHEYGTSLSEQEKKALLEYLKTL